LHNAQVINTLLQIFSNAQYRIDICGNSKFPSKVLTFHSVGDLIIAASRRKTTRQRYIFEITKENLKYCKNLMKLIEIRHLEENEANFAVNEIECLGFVTMQRESLQATYSNIAEIVEQQHSVFEALWNKAIPAETRILEIENDIKPEFLEVISDRKKATEIYIDLAKSVEKEALLLFANSKAIIRADRLGVLDCLINASKNKGALVKIISPITEENSQIVERTCEKAPDIKILNGGSSHSGLLVVDSAKFIRFGLKEPKAEEFSEAIGFVEYSNSKVGVYSARSFFELLWNEHIQYEKLKEADKMKNEFINVAAHELRTPIQPILSLSQVLQSKICDTKQLELLEAIVRNAKRLQRLTDDILDVTKIESKSLNLNKERFNLNDVISNIAKDLTNHNEKANNNNNNNNDGKLLKLLYKPDREDIFVEADKERITQVVSNLLNNSVKFTEEGTISIDVKVQEHDDDNDNNNNDIGHNIVIVSIKDTGEGIDSEILPKLFTKFASKSYQGTGLGLFICKSIVEAHGGKIWAENKNNDDDNSEFVDGKRIRGATFHFSLPIADMPADQQKQQQDSRMLN
jgi:two-component system, OmpR family, sensor histidine kinase VicK